MRRVVENGASGDPNATIVDITYAMMPRQVRVPVILDMYWVLADDDPALTTAADYAAQTLRVTR